jgi:branched-chain amino acid transport system substrate-binding protein
VKKIMMVLLVALLCLPISGSADHTLRIYIDADFSSSLKKSSISIERGLKTALSEVDFIVAGQRVEIVRQDHRGSSPRSKRNLDQYLQDEHALAVFSGLHSPPLLAHRDFINEQEILLLDPWAAAGPITRYTEGTNWIFRLSIDDTKAGRVMVHHALKHRAFKRPYLLLEETGWGKSNERTMGAALAEMNVSPVGNAWFNWGLSDLRAREIVRSIEEAEADVILLVANAPEAAVLFNAISTLNMEVAVVSHWGITGGDFFEKAVRPIQDTIDLMFIQTNFSFLGLQEEQRGYEVLQRARWLFPSEISEPRDIEAPTGFVHGYDLGKIFIRAVEQAGLTGDIKVDRRTVRDALERLDGSVEGLLKTYREPFSPFSVDAPDAHEALGEPDFTMGYFGENGEIFLEQVE